MLLEGQTAIVTGIGPGLGRSAALALAEEGANIVLGARTRAYLEEVAAEVEGRGRKALVVPTDVTKAEDTRSIAKAAFDHFGRVDILAQNAGWSGPYEHLVDVKIEDWQESLDGNVMGSMLMCKHVAPYMIEAGKGSIVITTSRIMRQGLQRRTVHAAAQAAITLLAQSLADELGPRGIRVNCVVPGHIWGPGPKGLYVKRAEMLGKTYEEVEEMYLSMMALHRVPRPEEIAKAVLFLASDLASAITGQTLDVNSGHHFH